MIPKLAAFRTGSEISWANHKSTKLRFFSTPRKLAVRGVDGGMGAGCCSSTTVVGMRLSFPLCNSLINIVFTHNAARSNTPIILIRVSIVKSSRLWGWETTYSRTFFRFFTTEVHVLIQGQASRKHGVSALHCISYSLSLHEGIWLGYQCPGQGFPCG